MRRSVNGATLLPRNNPPALEYSVLGTVVGSVGIFEPGQYLGVKSEFGQIQYLGSIWEELGIRYPV